MFESSEALRENLLALRREYAALQESSSHAQQLLDALEVLLAIQSDGDPFAAVFTVLRKVFVFSQALILAERDADDDAALDCIVAEPADLVGSRWPVGPLFRKVMQGRVVTAFSNVDAEEWQGATALGLNPAAPTLYMPIRAREQRGILILLHTVGAAGFNRSHVALAQRFSVLVSHALATRAANQSAAESRRLRELSEQLKQSEQEAKRNADLLNEMVQIMPVGVLVQDENGKPLMINNTAMRFLGMAPQEPRDVKSIQLPQHNLETTGISERRMHGFRAQLSSGVEHTGEHSIKIDGRLHTLLVTRKPVRIFDERLMLTISLDITERKRAEQELERRAFHDQLTGLPNRALIQEIVEKTLRAHRGSNKKFALAFIDLDNFKQVNDFYSHTIGDQLLVEVAQRITTALRGSDTLARISGDEFLLLIDPLESREGLISLIDRLLDTLKQPFHIEGHTLMTSASVGTSIYPLHGDSYELLRRSADSAMYRAKSLRKGSAAHFDASMGNALTARMDIEQRLRVAILQRRFRPAYQPKVKLSDGYVLGFEALARWVESDGSVIMPGTFIEMASELGLLDDISLFMLDSVARDLPLLTACFGAHITISLNVSALQAGDVNFMNRFVARIAAHGIGNQIILELTEDALVAAHTFQREVLPQLRTFGVDISIDDFGTGYSSLSVLSDITADEVKVDRAFITAIHERPRSQGILKAIESLCSVFQISLVAEGVESEEELDYLRSNTNIDCAQGYYFSRPQFIEDLKVVRFTNDAAE